jgi:hypothetical protein
MPMHSCRALPSFQAVRAALIALAVLPLLLPPAARGAAPPQRRKQAARIAPAPVPDLSLEAILERTVEYCRRLESSAFDFVCLEEITESVNPALDIALRKVGPVTAGDIPGSTRYSGPTLVVRSVGKIKHSFVYDYQCVRAGRTIREVRTQLKENGKKTVVPNADLATSVIVFGNALLGPVGLFAERFRGSYDFAVAGEDRIGKARVLVIDAKPRPGAPPARNLYGKAWVDPKTADILRIEWSENRVGHYDIFAERGKMFGRTPRLVMRSEFSAEKNGIRFASRLSVEEAYLTDKGKAFVRSKTEVVYKDFKFFSVEYDVRD